MKYYKLKEGVLSVGALKNKIFRSSDKGVYKETSWSPGTADELVKQGFLVLVSDEQKENVIKEPVLPLADGHILIPDEGLDKTVLTPGTEEKTGDNSPKEADPVVDDKLNEETSDEDFKNKKLLEDPSGLTDAVTEDAGKKSTAMDDISIEEIIKDLASKEIPFDENSTKIELYNLWVNS
jgi:hypothetical protein